jgi:putative thioredoxin
MIESIESPYIHAATSESFKSLVLDNSDKGPVLVNFWSRKAGPCLRQYPILDKLIHQYDGRLLLVNVDTENEVALTREYGITSIPTMKLFRDGKVVETWHGFQSEPDLIKILDNYVVRDSDQKLMQAVQLYAEGKTTEAYETITNAIVEDPVNPRLPLAMAKLLKHEERYEEALQVINASPAEIRNNKEIEIFRDLLTFHYELDPTHNAAELIAQLYKSPDDCATMQQLVPHYVIEQQYDEALKLLKRIIELKSDFAENYAQKTMLRIFNLLGKEHPLIAEYRPALRRYSH